MCLMSLATEIVDEPPPVGIGRERVSRMLVQALLVLIPEEMDDQNGNEEDRPVGACQRQQLSDQHVECRLNQ
jgi:hypothetical protein